MAAHNCTMSTTQRLILLYWMETVLLSAILMVVGVRLHESLRSLHHLSSTAIVIQLTWLAGFGVPCYCTIRAILLSRRVYRKTGAERYLALAVAGVIVLTLICSFVGLVLLAMVDSQ